MAEGLFIEYWEVDSIERNPWRNTSGEDFGFGEILLIVENFFAFVLKWWMLHCSSVCQHIIGPIKYKWVLWGWKYFEIYNNISVFFKRGVEKKIGKKLKIFKEAEELMDLFNKLNFQLTNMLSHYINFVFFF